MSRFIAFSPSLFHHLNGDVRAIAFALITSDAAFFLHNLIPFARKDLDRADLHTEETPLTKNLVPQDV